MATGTHPASASAPVSEVIEAAGAWLPRGLAAVERRLAEVGLAGGEVLGAQATATLRAGGKRMRPLLVLLCAGPDAGSDAIRAATAVELVHMATLVHDDVLDDAPLRRGRATVYATAGREVAVATGDLLLSRAFAELTEPGGGHQVLRLARASVSLARGELAQRADAFDLSVDEERYERRCLLKTAALFECACAIGADAAEGETSEMLASFGRRLGLAFQLLDDVLDVVGPPERTGKARGTDLLDGTVNLPLIVAIDREPELAELDLKGLDAAAAERVCDRIAATGAVDEVRRRAAALVESSKDLLDADPAALSAERTRLLRVVADSVAERYS